MFSPFYYLIKSDINQEDYFAAEEFAAKYIRPYTLEQIKAHMAETFPEAEDLPLPMIMISDLQEEEVYLRLQEEEYTLNAPELHLPSLGQYAPKFNMIVLFYKNILADRTADPQAIVQLVLARELFHALQMRATDKYTYGELGSVVTDASAAFYAYVYGTESADEKIREAAEALKENWSEHPDYDIPYTRAKMYLNTEGLSGKNKLRFVFLAAYKGMRSAYDALLNQKKRSFSAVRKYIKENYLEDDDLLPGFNLQSGQFGFRLTTKEMEAQENQYKNDERFREMLLKLMQDHEVESETAVYEGADLSKKVWERIMDEKKQTSKEQVLSIAVSMQLSIAETEALLSAYGYSLSNKSNFDLIVKYYIESEKYDLYAINETLREFGYDIFLGGGR